jgi:anaerobic glycerol-3-phosphate dehydrogenase
MNGSGKIQGMPYVTPALAVVFSLSMPYLRQLRQLRQELEELNDNLEVCENADERRELLKRMKILINETDQLISPAVLDLDGTQNRTNPS